MFLFFIVEQSNKETIMNINHVFNKNAQRLKREFMSNPKQYSNAGILFSDKDVFIHTAKTLHSIDPRKAESLRNFMVKFRNRMSAAPMKVAEIKETAGDINYLAKHVIKFVKSYKY